MNNAVLQSILSAKTQARKQLAALPFAEKIQILEKLRDAAPPHQHQPAEAENGEWQGGKVGK